MNIRSITHSIQPICEQPFEVVEVKGRGHPDTICDLMCEHVSYDLLNFYKKEFGSALHYNLDKALLVGGAAQPKFGGGTILQPAKLYLGDRATSIFEGRRFEIGGIIESSINVWLSKKLRYLRLNENLNFYNEVRPASSSLEQVEKRRASNDTSVGVGSWPPTPLEQMAIGLESHLNSNAFKTKYPESGEDIKIMAVRNLDSVKIVVAVAMVDRFINSLEAYVQAKETLKTEILNYLEKNYGTFKFQIEVNTLDQYEQGESGLHLTVTGLSCENGDSGQVGRGNRVNGAISFLRPQTMEAWAGKNPITHVGKIYSFAALHLARKLCESLPEIRQADVYLVGQIGNPVDRPAHVFCDVISENQSLGSKIESVLLGEIEKKAMFENAHLMKVI